LRLLRRVREAELRFFSRAVSYDVQTVATVVAVHHVVVSVSATCAIISRQIASDQ